jgi:alkanesulfonate monooxygenase SsuD/methylene tetrahydromethanopterin reductase-like flavin-dependent oxidoreductase (luciferase family)
LIDHVAELATAAEDAGFDSVWVMDGQIAAQIEAGADEVIFSFAFADAAGIAAVGQALGLG